MSYEIKRPPMAVILAAGTGSRLGPMTDTRPKCLLSVGGSAILERMIRNCLSCGISQFVLVLGHRSDQVIQFVNKAFRGIRVTFVINERYRETDTGYSLMLAAPAIGISEFIKLDADVVFETPILRNLMDSSLRDVLCIDRNSALAGQDVQVVADADLRVTEIGKPVDPATASGVPIGIEKISPQAGSLLFADLSQMMENAPHARDRYEAAYARLLAKGTAFHALDITGLNWIEIDTAEDLAAANVMFRSPITTISRGQQRALDEAAEKTPART